MTDVHASNREVLTRFRAALYDWDDANIRSETDKVFASDTMFHVCHPFGDLSGAEAFIALVLTPLRHALPDLERRDWISMAGPDEHGANWVGYGGHYVGTFARPWLDIPPSGQLVHMRFHEFYRIENGRIVEAQILWDIPEVMMQARIWPMVPSLGAEVFVPGPAGGSGILSGARDAQESDISRDIIVDMLNHMTRHPGKGGPEVMEMDRFWHDTMTWYGPAGIGTCRGIRGFRNWHQIPFLAAMPDRGKHQEEITYHFFGDGPFAAVTGWPNMVQTITDDGWLGIAPAGQRITMRSLDFWRIENGRIRENWVLVDLLHVYAQLGVDVFRRMRELAKTRVPGGIPFPIGDA